MNDSTAAIGPDTRERVISAALALLAREGRDALTTRAVAAAAGTQAPTIYRLFGDKQGLIDAVAEHGFAIYLAQKPVASPNDDPLDSLRHGWDLHVGFGLANPALFTAMYGDTRPGPASPAAARALVILRGRMHALARAGRLRVDEAQATEMLRAAACGVVFILLHTHEDARDPGLSAATREAMLAALATDTPIQPAPALVPAVNTLRALLPERTELSRGERQLFGEWLDRLANAGESPG